MLKDSIGWIATAVFALSYISKDQVTLRRIQASAAVLWIAYGAMVGATPVVVANAIVAGMALYSTRRKSEEMLPSTAYADSGSSPLLPPGPRAER
jgi:hypothetical protein